MTHLEFYKGFLTHFNAKGNAFIDMELTLATERARIDIIKFDDWLHEQHEYDEDKHGSCKDFITIKFSAGAANFIEKCL